MGEFPGWRYNAEGKGIVCADPDALARAAEQGFTRESPAEAEPEPMKAAKKAKKAADA